MVMLQKSGIEIAIITGRTSNVVKTRMESLGIKHVFQRQKHKLPAYFVRNLNSTSMGPEGLPERQLQTRYVVQWLDDETTEMESPRYHFHRQEGPTWYVTSEQGWLSADGEQALLSGRVTVLRPAGENNPPFKMITRDLRIQPKNNYMETDHPVFAKSREDTIDAVGMQAWMNEPGRIKFLSDVRANYVPR